MAKYARRTKTRLDRRIKAYEDNLKSATPGEARMMNKPGSQNRNKH